MLNLYAHLCLLHVVLVQLLMPPHVMFPPITVLLAHFTIYPLLSLMQPLLLIGFHNSCKFLLSPTCKHLSEFFVISSLQYDMVCTYFLENVLLLLPFVMLTGVATHQIGNPLVLTQFILAQMPFSWSCKKQSTVARWSTKVEYRTIGSTTTIELLWLQQVLHKLGINISQPPTIFSDNIGATHLCASPSFIPG